MEYSYISYTKLINNETHYFVKKYLLFPELNDVRPVLTNYGMHTDFYKACSIAFIYDDAIRQQLFKEIQVKEVQVKEVPANVQQAKLVDLNAVKFSRKIFNR